MLIFVSSSLCEILFFHQSYIDEKFIFTLLVRKGEKVYVVSGSGCMIYQGMRAVFVYLLVVAVLNNKLAFFPASNSVIKRFNFYT